MNGIVIRTFSFNVANSGGNLYASATAPGGPADLATRIVFEFASASADDSATLPYELYIPPGLGLWVTNSGTTVNAFMTYDLLTPAEAP